MKFPSTVVLFILKWIFSQFGVGANQSRWLKTVKSISLHFKAILRNVQGFGRLHSTFAVIFCFQGSGVPHIDPIWQPTVKFIKNLGPARQPVGPDFAGFRVSIFSLR